MADTHAKVRHYILQTVEQVSESFITSIEWPYHISNVLSTVIQDLLNEEDTGAIRYVGRYRSDVINRIDFALHKHAMKMSDENEDDELLPSAYKTIWNAAIMLLNLGIKSRILNSKLEGERQNQQVIMLHAMEETAEEKEEEEEEDGNEAVGVSESQSPKSIASPQLKIAEPRQENARKKIGARIGSRSIAEKGERNAEKMTRKPRSAIGTKAARCTSEPEETAPATRRRKTSAANSKV